MVSKLRYAALVSKKPGAVHKIGNLHICISRIYRSPILDQQPKVHTTVPNRMVPDAWVQRELRQMHDEPVPRILHFSAPEEPSRRLSSPLFRAYASQVID